jgi:F0F1-type ATP synthase assembly protein I
MTNDLGYTSPPLLRALGKPILTVLRWQILATVMMALVAAAILGTHAALSAAAGGLISVIAGLAAAIIAARGARSAGGVVLGALRAEGVKIGLAVLLLWLVLANYADVVAVVLIGAFAVTMLIFAMAFFVREY